MEMTHGNNTDQLTTPQKLKKYMDERGIRYSWLASKLDLTPQWLYAIFRGNIALSESRQKQIEEILDIKL